MSTVTQITASGETRDIEDSRIGNLSSLQTSEKTSIVGAINELAGGTPATGTTKIFVSTFENEAGDDSWFSLSSIGNALGGHNPATLANGEFIIADILCGSNGVVNWGSFKVVFRGGVTPSYSLFGYAGGASVSVDFRESGGITVSHTSTPPNQIGVITAQYFSNN